MSSSAILRVQGLGPREQEDMQLNYCWAQGG